MHVSGALGFLHRHSALLGFLLFLEGGNLLIGNLAFREDLDQIRRQDDVLDIDATRFNVILGQLGLDVLEGLLLDFLPGFDELDGVH